MKSVECFKCGRIIPEGENQENEFCLGRLVNHRNKWAKDKDGEELVAVLCLKCGRANGNSTYAEMKAKLARQCR